MSRRASAGRTMFLISHRFNTFQYVSTKHGFVFFVHIGLQFRLGMRRCSTKSMHRTVRGLFDDKARYIYRYPTIQGISGSWHVDPVRMHHQRLHVKWNAITSPHPTLPEPSWTYRNCECEIVWMFRPNSQRRTPVRTALCEDCGILFRVSLACG